MMKQRALKISEQDFQECVVQLAKLYHWACYHTFSSRKSAAGFPDLVLAKRFGDDAQLIFAELKTELGKLTDEQAGWISLLSAVPGITVRVWRPSDQKEIEGILRGERMADPDAGLELKPEVEERLARLLKLPRKSLLSAAEIRKQRTAGRRPS